MVYSMTALASREIKGSWGNASWELHSVNQRYLETNIHLPEQFRSLEPLVRERIRLRITRGKVECRLHIDANLGIQNTLILNTKLAKQLIEAAQWVKAQSNEGEINPLDILHWPGVIIATEQDLDTISVELLSGLEIAINDFINVRENEGYALKTFIEQRLSDITTEIVNIRKQIPTVLTWQRERLLAKLKDVQVQIDSNRLEQELVIQAQKIDVSEELDRLDAHVKETYQILLQKGAVGHRLNFMMQEFNRESNTLASKSINIHITSSAIKLKVLIEQMRQQIQNIE